MRKLTISIDFDGTIASLNYPKIGVLMDCKEIINDWYNRHTIIISTCRAGKELEDARQFLDDNGVKYHYLNENSQELIEKYGMDTRKISADVYIDDKNIPLMIDWRMLESYIGSLEERMPLIICLVGESGSGKSTLAKKISRAFGHNFIESYTDRPSRGEGDDHTFLTPEEFDQIKEEDMIAFTNFGSHRYCCLFKDVKDKNLYIIDEFGLKHLIEHHSDKYDIRTIRVVCNEDERIRRVGPDRVLRDTGKFTMPLNEFGYVIRTDVEYDVYSLKYYVN